MRYPHRRVRLYDKDPIVCAIWGYLIRVSPGEIRNLPLVFDHIDELKVPQEVKWLLGFWANRATVNPSKSPSKWMRQLGQQQTGVYWSVVIRERLARQVDFIRHWTVTQCSYEQIPDDTATWFIDPPYDSKAGEYYRYGRKDIDYKHLGEWCQSRSGQVIVCEQVGANWLDFRPFRDFKGLRGVSKEAIWTKTDESPGLLSPKSSNLISFPAANKDGRKHYLLAPPELRDETKAEFGDDLYKHGHILTAAGTNAIPLPKILRFHVPEGSVIGDVTLGKEVPSEVRKEESQLCVGGEVSPLTSIHNQEFTSWAASYSGPRFHASFSDVPFGIGFMGKAWDSPGGPAAYQALAKQWGEAMLSVLYPGAVVFLFGGTRTWHRLASGMEDAGFEMFDTVMWLRGDGFPKAQDIGKLIDRKNGNGSKVRGTQASAESSSWSGHKTSQFKPAWQPVLCLRAPRGNLTFAELALKYGTGSLNVDGARFGSGAKKWDPPKGGIFHASEPGDQRFIDNPLGRYPANLILDEESAKLLDAQSGVSKSRRDAGGQSKKGGDIYLHGMQSRNGSTHTDEGGASRFIYVAKASKKERGEGNSHPCVKPLALCRHLATLLLPPSSEEPRRILVPFAGSGSEMIGAKQAGWDEIVGVDQDAHYCEIAKRRLKALADCLGQSSVGALPPVKRRVSTLFWACPRPKTKHWGSGQVWGRICRIFGTPDAAFGKTDGIPEGIAAYDLNNGYDWKRLPLPDNYHAFGFWDPPYDHMYRLEALEIWRVCRRLAILHPRIYPKSWFVGCRREAVVAVTFGPYKVIRCLSIFTKEKP